MFGIPDIVANTAADLAKSDNVQNKTASLLGMLFPYAGIEKRALDMYITDFEKSDMSSESKLIAILSAKKTIKKLKNQKSIADKAVSNAKEGTAFDSSSGVNLEWLERFMDSAGFVSEEQVQIMWGKILAKEFEKPGSTPLNMIRILSEITPQCAQAFQKICSMKRTSVAVDSDGKAKWIRNDIVVPYEGNEGELRSIGLSFNIFNELDTLGLIKFDAVAGFIAVDIPEMRILTYTGGVTKEIEKRGQNELPIGNVMLTEAGECLDRIVESEQIENFEALERRYMEKKNIVFKEESEYHIVNNKDGSMMLIKQQDSK